MLRPQVSYLPLVMAMGICPDDPRTFFMQQYRWCMGSAALVMSRGFWKSNVSKMQKLCFLSGMMYYVATAVVSTRLHVTTIETHNSVFHYSLVVYCTIQSNRGSRSVAPMPVPTPYGQLVAPKPKT